MEPLGIKLLIIYSAGEIAVSMKSECLQNRTKTDSQKEDTQKQEVLDLRRWVAWISNIIEIRKTSSSLSNKHKSYLKKIKRKHHVSSSSKLKEIKEKLHCRLNISSSKQKKAKLSKEVKRENNQFANSQKNWFKQKENNSVNNKKKHTKHARV